MSKIEVFYEATPNPNSMKFNFTKNIAEESIHFDDPQKVNRSPLAQKLFGFPWMLSVFIGPSFVTITKQEWVEWKVLADPLSDLLAEHIENDEPVLLAFEPDSTPSNASANSSTNEAQEGDSPIVQKIKAILNHEIRPAVAMDGGDIVFSHFENNRLYLHMQGACSGCPSSAITLKEGIESRLKEVIPELEEVISI